MTPLITINATTIEQLTYHGQPVVTIQMIADVHGIAAKQVHASFQRHLDRFTEGKHYFRLDFAEASQLLTREEANPNGLYLFTEKGYFFLVKPMRDDTAWDVHERMVDDYFHYKTSAPMPQLHDPTPAEAALAIAQAVVSIERRQVAIEARQDRQEAQLTALIDRQPPADKLRPGEWLRRTAKPHLGTALMTLLNAACKRRELPAYWRPDGYDWQVPFYTADTIAQAYAEVTKQLSFFPRQAGGQP